MWNYVEEIADLVCDNFLPKVRDHLELAFVISTVLLAVKTQDIAWHKNNLIYSLFRTLLTVKGAELISAVCLGTPPVAVLACNTQLVVVALLWWLALFAPYDIFNQVVYVKVRDIQPVVVLVTLMTALRHLVAANEGVSSALKSYPGSFTAAILIGTLNGNGAWAIASVFGDFAKSVSSEAQTKKSFIASLVMTLVGIGIIKIAAADVIFTVLLCLMLPCELAAVFGTPHIDVFEPVYGIICKIVTCDFCKSKVE